jgi:hypothetical protein
VPEKISGFFIKLFLLTFPFQIQTMLYKGELFSGQFNFFAAFFLTLGEIFLLLSLLFYAVHLFWGSAEQDKVPVNKIRPVEFGLVFSLTALMVWNLATVLWAGDKVLSLFLAFRWLELAGLIWLLSRGIIKRETILKYLFWGAFVQVVIAVGQYIKQGSLGLTFLGEPELGADYLNVAKVDLGGGKILRSYGTFPHANLFGGYMFVCLALLIQQINKHNLLRYIHFLVFFLIGLLISFSRSAWLATLVFTMAILLQKAVKTNWKQLVLLIVSGLFILVVLGLDQVILARIMNFSIQNWDDRMLFSGIAKEMVAANPIAGVGLGGFIGNMSVYQSGVLSPWLFQPAHNLFLMVASESGMVGLLVWLIFLFSGIRMIFESMKRLVLTQKFPAKVLLALFCGMMVLAALDHYMYTLWSGQVLLFMTIGLIYLDYRDHLKALL